MADYAGVARETMSRYLSGKAPAPLAVVRVLALRTGVPFAWIQDGTTPPRHSGPDQGGSLTGGKHISPVRELRAAA